LSFRLEREKILSADDGEGYLLNKPETMVCCYHNSVLHLFLLESSPARSSILRIEPVGAIVNTKWPVDTCTEALTVTSTGHLLVTMMDGLKEYDTDGGLIRVINPAKLVDDDFDLHKAYEIPDGTGTYQYQYPIISCIHHQNVCGWQQKSKTSRLAATQTDRVSALVSLKILARAGGRSILRSISTHLV